MQNQKCNLWFNLEVATNQESTKYFFRICSGDSTKEGSVYEVSKEDLETVCEKSMKLNLCLDKASKYAWKRFRIVNGLTNISIDKLCSSFKFFDGEKKQMEDSIINQIWSLRK